MKGKSQDTYETTVKPRANQEEVDDPEESQANLEGVDDPEESQANLEGVDDPEESQANLEGESLNLANLDCPFTDEFPQLLTKYSATLRDLDMSNNMHGGEGLDSVPVLKQLEKLNLGNCRNLTNTGLLKLLAKCSSTLKDLNLYKTGYGENYIELWSTSNSLESIPVLKQLEILNLSENSQLTDTFLLQFLVKCSTTLKDLDLTSTGISAEGLESVPVLKLETLRLKECNKLTNTGLLQLLAKCSATLKDLNVEFSAFNGDGMEIVLVLEQLETLNLSGCTMHNPQFLAKCSRKLKNLYLKDTNFTGECLESIPAMSLVKADLESCLELTNSCLQQFLVKCSATLEDLNLSRTEISGEGLEIVPVQKLEKLSLELCRKLTNAGLLQLLTICSKTLKNLVFFDNVISGEGLRSAPVLRLEKLSLESCGQLTNEGLLQFLTKCSATLEELTLDDTGISGASLADWIERQNLRKLRMLGLRSCQNVTDEDIERIRAVLPQCEIDNRYRW